MTQIWLHLSAAKVLITCWFNDKILVYHFLVHEGCVIMMFYLLQQPKSGNQKFIIEPTGDKSPLEPTYQ